MLKRTLLLSISILLVLTLISPSFAGIEKIPGVSKSVPFLFTISFTKDHQAAIEKITAAAVKSPQFEKMAEAFKQKNGIDFPKEMVSNAKNITSFTLAAFLNTADLREDPCALLLATFDDEKAAAEFVKNFKNTMISGAKKQSKEMLFTESDENGLKVSTPSLKSKDMDPFKTSEPRLIQSGSSAGLFIFKKKDAAKSLAALKSVAAVLKNPAEGILSNKSAKAAFDKLAKDATFFFYMDGSLYKQGAVENGRQEMSDLVSSIAAAGTIDGAISKINTKWAVALGEMKDKDAAANISFIKTLLSAEKNERHPANILPASVSTLLSFKLNLGKEFIASPQIAAAKPVIFMMSGLSLEEDLLSWMNGDIFFAFGEYTSEFYVGIGSKNAENAAKFFVKFQDILKKAQAAFEFKDDTAGGIKVRSAALSNTPPFLKDIVITVGTLGDYMLIASSKAAFEKAAATKKETALASSPEVKDLAAWDPSSFLNFYMNYDKFQVLAKKFNEDVGSEFKDQKFNAFTKFFTACANFENNEISGSSTTVINPEKVGEGILDILNTPQAKEAIERIKNE